MTMELKKRRTSSSRSWWKPQLFTALVTLACATSQDITACCDKAEGSCRSVCEKMSMVEIGSDSGVREDRIQNIYKFCTPDAIEFWICMNQTIQEVVSGSSWWGRTCCALARAPSCRRTCLTATDFPALTAACRRSDEIALFDCVRKQENAQECCSHTQSIACHDACEKAVWRIGHSHVDATDKNKAYEACDQSPELLKCFRDLTASTVHDDTSKYLPCCHEASTPKCRSTCETILRQTGESQEIADALTKDCGAPALHGSGDIWKCFLRKDEPSETKDVIPHDVAKLHCCHKAATINCRRLCLNTFDAGWQSNWQRFYSECASDPQEIALAQCIEEVEAPCSLGCSGLTYCSQLNNRPTTLFRSCTAQADLNAHLAVAEQKGNGVVTIAGLQLPLKNSSQCPTDIWKSVACALHVKPCTPKGHSSLLCAPDCTRLVSSCVDWSRAPAPLSAPAACARLAPSAPSAPCVPLADFMSSNDLTSSSDEVMIGPDPPLLSSNEMISSPCAGATCNATQVCVVNRNCVQGGCTKYSCVDGCPLGDNSAYVVPLGSWVRVPIASSSQKQCFKICKCSHKGLTSCQPLPCVVVDNCRLHDKVVMNGDRYYLECNPCTCVLGERVCSRRACRPAALLTALPCNCPAHHLPVRADRLYPNACLAKCAGATDAELSWRAAACPAAGCGRRSCLPARAQCLSPLQKHCDAACVNTTNCMAQPTEPVCDADGRTHINACHLIMSGRRFAYWGQCLKGCNKAGTICGVNGVTYISECAAFAELISVDYSGPCLAVGPISDLMEPKCQIDNVICPPLKKPKCLGFTAPGACCPKCGGALRILISKKQIDRALYGTNVSTSIVNLNNILKALERQVKIAECVLRGYLTIETEIFISIESNLDNPTDLQLHVCVLEAEKIADLINRESAIISTDLGLSALVYALPVHSYPTQAASNLGLSCLVLTLSSFLTFILR